VEEEQGHVLEVATNFAFIVPKFFDYLFVEI
jgi:hypothetical protein